MQSHTTLEFVPSQWIHAHGAWARGRIGAGLDGGTEATEQPRLPWAFFAVWAIAFAVILSQLALHGTKALT